MMKMKRSKKQDFNPQAGETIFHNIVNIILRLESVSDSYFANNVLM